MNRLFAYALGLRLFTNSLRRTTAKMDMSIVQCISLEQEVWFRGTERDGNYIHVCLIKLTAQYNACRRLCKIAKINY